MRSRSAITPPSGFLTTHPQESAKHAVLKGIRNALTACIDWFRGGYPDEAPRTGYSPLLALSGPLALTSAQKDRISKNLEGQEVCPINIDVTITKVTNRLPTPTQTRAVSRALHHRASQQ